MTLMRTERECLEQHLPGLDAELAALPLMTLESRESPALKLFREAGGPGLLVPAEHGGRGVDALAAVRMQRALGARSPSLAVAATMHHFSVASLAELTTMGGGFEWVVSPKVRAQRVPGGLSVNGSKKPCSLTWSMDLMSASVAVQADADGPEQLAIVLIPATDSGLSRRRFWESWVLGGAESDEVTLTDVFVPDQMVVYPQDATMTDPVQGRGFLWFEMMVTASYVGVASALVERVLGAGRGTAQERVALSAEVEAAMAAVESLARSMPAVTQQDVEDQLTRALCVRYAVEGAVARASMAAAALLGGMAFIQSSDVAYLLAASRALSLHPPAMTAVSDSVDRYLRGGRFNV